jgi:hypothetical protein
VQALPYTQLNIAPTKKATLMDYLIQLNRHLC